MWLHIVNIYNKAKGEIWILAVIDNSLNLSTSGCNDLIHKSKF